MVKPRKEALMATCGVKIAILIRFLYVLHRVTHLVVVVPQHEPYNHVDQGVV